MDANSFIEQGKALGYVHETESVETLTIDGHRDSYKVYEIRVDKLKYNIRNGRIATYISRHKQEVGELPEDGTEEMNALIEKFIEDGNPQRLKKTRLDIKAKGQQRPAVVLSDGTIIDGNRRFTCMRQLAREEGEARYLRCFVLDSALDDKSLKGLELELQFGQDEKVAYDPVSRLVDIYEWCRVGDLDTEFYRTKSGMTKNEMDSFLGQVDLMVEFLQFINADGQFHIVQDLKLQGPLNELYLTLKKCHDEDKAEDIKVAVFTSFLTKGDTDITRHVRDMGKIALSTEGDEFLEEQIDVAQTVLESFEKLPEGQDVSIAFIRDVIRADKETIRRQDASFERARRLMNNEKVKDGQVKEVEKAKLSLEKVETELLPKLSQEALSAIKESLDGIKELIKKLEAVVDEAMEG